MEEYGFEELGLVAIQTNRWNDRMLHLSRDGVKSLCNAGDASIVPGKKTKPATYATCWSCLHSVNLKQLIEAAKRRKMVEGKLYVVEPFRQGTKYHYAQIFTAENQLTFGVEKRKIIRTMCGHAPPLETTVSDVESTKLRATCMYCLGSPQTPDKYRDPIAAENIRYFRSKGGIDRGATDGPIWEL